MNRILKLVFKKKKTVFFHYIYFFIINIVISLFSIIVLSIGFIFTLNIKDYFLNKIDDYSIYYYDNEIDNNKFQDCKSKLSINKINYIELETSAFHCVDYDSFNMDILSCFDDFQKGTNYVLLNSSYSNDYSIGDIYSINKEKFIVSGFFMNLDKDYFVDFDYIVKNFDVKINTFFISYNERFKCKYLRKDIKIINKIFCDGINTTNATTSFAIEYSKNSNIYSCGCLVLTILLFLFLFLLALNNYNVFNNYSYVKNKKNYTIEIILGVKPKIIKIEILINSLIDCFIQIVVSFLIFNLLIFTKLNDVMNEYLFSLFNYEYSAFKYQFNDLIIVYIGYIVLSIFSCITISYSASKSIIKDSTINLIRGIE